MIHRWKSHTPPERWRCILRGKRNVESGISVKCYQEQEGLGHWGLKSICSSNVRMGSSRQSEEDKLKHEMYTKSQRKGELNRWEHLSALSNMAVTIHIQIFSLNLNKLRFSSTVVHRDPLCRHLQFYWTVLVSAMKTGVTGQNQHTGRSRRRNRLQLKEEVQGSLNPGR